MGCVGGVWVGGGGVRGSIRMIWVGRMGGYFRLIYVIIYICVVFVNFV